MVCKQQFRAALCISNPYLCQQKTINYSWTQAFDCEVSNNAKLAHELSTFTFVNGLVMTENQKYWTGIFRPVKSIKDTSDVDTACIMATKVGKRLFYETSNCTDKYLYVCEDDYKRRKADNAITTTAISTTVTTKSTSVTPKSTTATTKSTTVTAKTTTTTTKPTTITAKTTKPTTFTSGLTNATRSHITTNVTPTYSSETVFTVGAVAACIAGVICFGFGIATGILYHSMKMRKPDEQTKVKNVVQVNPSSTGAIIGNTDQEDNVSEDDHDYQELIPATRATVEKDYTQTIP